jgi:aminotransferase EvaB
MRVLDGGRYVHGPEHERFERELRDYLGVGHCIGVASGTDALELALKAVGCRDGDEVVLAANAGFYSATAARAVRARITYADVDPRTLTLSATTLEPTLRRETRAVVVTHLYGLMADIEPIVALCRERRIALVEDCAQSAGARRGGRMAGGFGDVAAFSFYPTKNLGALGDGGLVATNDDQVADDVQSLRQYGWESKYRVTDDGGRNSRLDELQAAILRTRLPHLDGWNARRRDIAARYADVLPEGAGRLVSRAGADYVAHLAIILASDRDALRSRLTEAGIATDVHYPIPDHRQPLFGSTYVGLHLPVTEDAVERVLTLPCFPELTDEEVDHVCGVLSEL